MGKQYTEIPDSHINFINEQKIFFVGTATKDSRVSISPKGMDSLRVLSKNRVIWLNVTGSGNETSAHVQENPRMTIMFAAFEGVPKILRLYGQAKVIHKHNSNWSELFCHFTALPGARQIFDLSVDLVQRSCGMAVPNFEYVGDRQQLKDWALKKDEETLKEYWKQKNQHSLDGIPTNIVNSNT